MPGMFMPPSWPLRIIAMLLQQLHIPPLRCGWAGLSAIGSSAAAPTAPHIPPMVDELGVDAWACWPAPHI
jgi:hypothetical protein